MSTDPTKHPTGRAERAAERDAWEVRHAAWVAETQRQLLILARKWGLT